MLESYQSETFSDVGISSIYKNSTSYTVRCQVQEASEVCHRRYCHDNGIMTYEEFLAKGSL